MNWTRPQPKRQFICLVPPYGSCYSMANLSRCRSSNVLPWRRRANCTDGRNFWHRFRSKLLWIPVQRRTLGIRKDANKSSNHLRIYLRETRGMRRSPHGNAYRLYAWSLSSPRTHNRRHHKTKILLHGILHRSTMPVLGTSPRRRTASAIFFWNHTDFTKRTQRERRDR